MKSRIILGAAAIFALTLGSCVTNKKYNQMADQYRTANEGLIECNANTKSMEVMIKDLKAQNADLKEAYSAIKTSLDQAMANNHQGSVNISKLVDEINASNKYIKQLVEGNTDNVPISRTNIRNNWDLSALRASSVVQALQNDFGIDPSRLTAGGRGEYNPIATNSTAAGRQENRRTEIIITPKLDQFLDLIDKAPDTDSSATTR